MKRATDGKILHITELLSAIAVILTGLFLMFAALKLFPFSIDKSWLIAVYICIFVIALITAVMQKNMIGVGVAAALLTLIIAQVMILTGYAHRQIYPLYVLAVPFGITLGSCFAHKYGTLFKAAVSLVGMGLLLFSESFSVLTVKVVLPLIAVYYGIIGAVYSCLKLRKDGKRRTNE